MQYNKVFGYYIEITKANLSLAPHDYIRKQTLVNAERFITAELKEWADSILGAEEKANALEQTLFEKVRQELLTYVPQIQRIAEALALVVPGDSLVGFVTIGKGVTIHRKDCLNLERLAIENARLVDVEWKTSSQISANTRLYVETVDKPGILANLSALISSLNINIVHLEASSTQDKKGHITLVIEVKDLTQLKSLMHKISQMEGSLRIRR